MKTIIIKIGTASISAIPPEKGINLKVVQALTNVIAKLKKLGYKSIIVTSGAVALGMQELGLHSKKRSIQEKQMSASIGQVNLMEAYKKFFSKHKISVAQILLTRDGFEQKNVYLNTKKTVNLLLKKNVVPIINENDAVANEEIKFGDNDMLSALVSRLINADSLIILTDEKGLYDSNPKLNKNARLIPTVKKITKKIESMAKGKGSDFSLGGMSSKIQAAKLATKAGIKTHILYGREPEQILNLLKNKNIGTTFLP